MIGPQPADVCTPHRAGMLLIDTMLSKVGEVARSETTIRADHIFLEPGLGVPGYVGFELMAQTVNAFDGWRRVERGEEPTIGFLLGCRTYKCAIDYFVEGRCYITEVKSLLKDPDDEMVSFECRIIDESGAEVASATVNAFRPYDPDAFLKAQLGT